MKKSRKVILRLSCVCVMTAYISGCFFPEVIEVFVSSSEEGFTIFFSLNSDVANCETESEPGVAQASFNCTYLGGEGIIDSNVILTGADILFLLFLDPLIIQLPANASNFAGSFLHTDSGTSGNLAITSGLASFRADLDTTITAEAGTQFVIIDLPAGAPTAGNFAFNFNFQVPLSTTAVDFKPMFTGRVDLAQGTFYPPLLPCTADFASIPTSTIPLPAGGNVTLPVGSVQGCNNVTYNFGQATAVPPTAIPALSLWGLIVMSGLLGFFSVWRSRAGQKR